MIEFRRIAGFDWDAGNARKHVATHAVDQAEAEQVFFNDPLLIVDDARHSGAGARYHALGRTDAGRLVHATFTLRLEGGRQDGALIRVISARDMSRRERVRYGEEG